MKTKVLRNAKLQIRQRRKKYENIFAEKYNRLKEFRFPAKEDINMEKYVCLPKLPESFFQQMTKSALAIYPVICSRANFEENTWIQLPQDHIAKMAGISTPTVAKGIDHLLNKGYGIIQNSEAKIPLLSRQKATEGERHFYIYKAGFIRKEMMDQWKGGYFVFHTAIIDSGIWAELNPRSKAIYLAMRGIAKFDSELYSLIEEIDLDGMELNDFYNYGQFINRKWDVCNLSLSEICRLANIERSNIRPILDELWHYRLVEKVLDDVFKVYMRPKIR